MAEKGWSHEDLAFECGFARTQVTNLLKTGRCRPNTLSIIAEALGVEITELLHERKVEEMKIVLDPGAKIPTRAHLFDAGLDLYAKENEGSIVIAPFGGSVNIDTGVHVQIPNHFCGLIKSKSGLMSGKRVLTDGTIDAGYTGSIHVTLFNHGEYSYVVEPGSKIAQLVIVPCCLPPLEVVDSLEDTERGDNGFGSSGMF